MTIQTSIAGQAWFATSEVRALMDALGTARFVGGCVRNGLLGLPVDDIDIATPLMPDAVAAVVEARGMKAIDTGAEHGTVTVVVNGHPFEVTTLRRDVSTDGRRATVAFTTAWQEDAARRDFTMNALYADLDGRVHDYHHGLEDLCAGIVRFIGDADTRIAEDHLRILRLFRIHAWYGRGEIDPVALVACRAGRGLIRTLSGERIQKEMFKLLRGRSPVHSVRSMRDVHVLEEVIPGVDNIDVLSRLCETDAINHFDADPIMRLRAMVADMDVARGICSRWRLSNHDKARFLATFKAEASLQFPIDDGALGPVLYRHGVELIDGLVRLAWARSQDAVDDAGWLDLMRRIRAWQRPELPVDGADVLRAGIPEGPMVGRVLEDVEAWWIACGFPSDRHSVQQRLQATVARHMSTRS
jgi:poly(A) polymerase